jgi:hypothetical protein
MELNSGERREQAKNDWRDVVQEAYRLKAELEARKGTKGQLSAEAQRQLRAAISLTRKYHFSGRRKRQT